MPFLTVLVPFYQREPGLLRAAAASVAAQSIFVPGGAPDALAGLSRRPAGLDAPDLAELLVVDDGSPVSAASELDGLALPPGLRVRIVERENGGAAAARNTGLDAVAPGTRALAVIDSDDVWDPFHLERGLFALEGGATLYTSNWIPVESPLDAFTFFDKLELAGHRPVAEAQDLFEYVGDFAAQEVERSIGRPSALVFDWSLYGDLRNDTSLEHGSEDQYWRLEIAERVPRVVFSSRPEVHSGVGVSVFSGAHWASEKGLLILRDRISCAHRARRRLRLTDRAHAARRRIVSKARTDLVGVAVHLFRKGPRPSLRSLASVVRTDPMLAWAWPLHLGRVIARRRAAQTDTAHAGALRPTRERPAR